MASRSEQSKWTDIICFWRGLKFFFSLFLFTFIHIITGFLGIYKYYVFIDFVITRMDTNRNGLHSVP